MSSLWKYDEDSGYSPIIRCGCNDCRSHRWSRSYMFYQIEPVVIAEHERPYGCRLHLCGARYKRASDLARHVRTKKHYGYYRHRPDVDPNDVQCQHCDYMPGQGQINPRKQFRQHMRRNHYMYAVPYVIELP